MGALHSQGWERLTQMTLSGAGFESQEALQPVNSESAEGAGFAGGPHSHGLWWVALAAVMSGALLGFYQLLNTGIGWHLASGRWMLDHHTILRTNPFTFSAAGKAWLNHEWIFQILVALADRLGGSPGLVILRMLAAAVLVLLLYCQFRRTKLLPGAALLFAVLCVLAARWRLFLRPELMTLLLLPLGLELYLCEQKEAIFSRAVKLSLIMVIGVNAHAGMLLLPLLASAAFFGEQLQALFEKAFDGNAFRRGVALLAVIGASSLINPWGIATILAPLRLADLVSKPWVKNPEWSFPTWSRFPELYIIIPAAIILLLLAEKRWSRRLCFGVLAILGMRYVRNEGVFFVLLPILLGPAIARIGHRIQKYLDESSASRLSALSAVAALVLCLVSLNAGGYPLGLGYAPDRYPIKASDFLKKEGLLEHRIYNDVRFGGWLIGAFYPPTRFFIDDRNEVHEELLERIWEIQSASSTRRWQELLDSYGIRGALLKYKAPVPVQDPEGTSLGDRGWSALWFPSKRWALVYWDDQAMVLVDRKTADPEWLKGFEYSEVRPDDGEFLRKRVAEDPGLKLEIARELGRRLSEDPTCQRAIDLVSLLLP